MSLVRGRPLPGADVPHGTSLPGSLPKPQIQLLPWQLLTNPDPGGVCLLLHCFPQPISSHYSKKRGKILRKAPPFQKNFCSLKSLASATLLAPLGQFQLSVKHASFLSCGLEYSRSLRNKKLCPLLLKASLKVKWDDGYKDVISLLISLLVLVLTTV